MIQSQDDVDKKKEDFGRFESEYRKSRSSANLDAI